MFALVNAIFLTIAMIIDNLLGTSIPELGYGLFYVIYALAVFIPSLSLTVRRLHDVGKSGWMLFIILIPFVGAIWFLVLTIIDSNIGENQFGTN